MHILSLSAFVAAALVGVSQASPAKTVTRTTTVTRVKTQAPTATVTRTTTRTVPCYNNNNKRDESFDDLGLEAREHKEHHSRKKGHPLMRSADGNVMVAGDANQNLDKRARVKTVYDTKTVTRTVGGGTRTIYSTSTVQGSCTAAPTSSSSQSSSTPTTTSSASSGGSSGTFNGPGYGGASGIYAPQQLDLHNAKRALHYTSTESTPALTWNDTLASYALTYALKCNSVHSHGPYGENLAWETGSENDQSNSLLFNLWYNEISYYNYSNPQINDQDGHFTQVVWKDSLQLGCALVQCPGSSDGGLWGSSVPFTSLTCEYSPPGNYIGEEAQEVLPLGS